MKIYFLFGYCNENEDLFPVWVLSRIGYEYNDNYYYRPECNGSTPILTYIDKHKAEKVCRNKNIETLKGLEIDYYMSDRADLHDDFYKKYCTKNEPIKIRSDLTQKDYDDIMKITGLVFFEIKQIYLER